MSILNHESPAVQPDHGESFDVPFRADFDHFADECPEFDLATDFDLPECTEPAESLLTFSAWIEAKATAVRGEGKPASEWLARRIEGLARLARRLAATTPDEFDDREFLQDSEFRDNLLTQGFDRGYNAGRTAGPYDFC